MEWLDYRKKLGIGFNDDSKGNYFFTKMFNGLSIIKGINYSANEYVNFCNMTGNPLITNWLQEYYWRERYQHILGILKDKRLLDFLAIYIAFVNTKNETTLNYEIGKSYFINLLQNMLKQSQIPFEVYEDQDGYFVFPKGAAELDKPLVSDVLMWLVDYPKTKKTYSIALKQYSDGVYIRDVADNLRKSLEEFFQEFLGNTKNLANNKSKIGIYLKENNAEQNMINMLITLISTYDILNNEIAKHNDKVDEKYLEFLLYQTGIFIRMLMVVKNAEQSKDGD